MARKPLHPLQPGWVLVDGLPIYHRFAATAGPGAPAMVHVHGFGISGTYLEPTAALLATRYRTFVPDLPGMGRSIPPERSLDIPGLARALLAYCEAVGVHRATFIGNSLGCPIVLELASIAPARIERAVLVSPAGGPNNQPMPRALAQMAVAALREPPSLIPIAVRDYLRFGPFDSWKLFRAMTRYPSLDRVEHLSMPTLVIAGDRDPLVRIDRAHVFAELPYVQVVRVPGAHALNYSTPGMIAALIERHAAGEPLVGESGVTSAAVRIDVAPPDPPAEQP